MRLDPHRHVTSIQEYLSELADYKIKAVSIKYIHLPMLVAYRYLMITFSPCLLQDIFVLMLWYTVVEY